MFKVEGLSVPAAIKVDEEKKKKKSDTPKLSGDDLQGMFNELNPSKEKKQKKSEAKQQKNDRGSSDQATTSNGAPSKADSRTGMRTPDSQKKRDSTDKTAPPTKRAKSERNEARVPADQQPLNQRQKKKTQLEPSKAKSAAKPEQSKHKQDTENKPKAAPSPTVKSTKQLTPLQLKMQQKLSGSRFRWINEQLYTTSSEHALQIFQEQPQVFQEYHDGFRHQVESWPENPVVSLVQQFKDRLQKPLNAPGGIPADKKSGQISVADMGCGEAELALELGRFQHRKARFDVHSFDLYAANERITAADIANVPLPDESCHVVVFCLALMGTNLVDFITEGIRILKPGGLIWIAEIKSRFSGYDTFIDALKQMGLYHRTTDESNKMFVKFEFTKLPHKMAQATEERPELTLKPCIYKRR